MIYNNLTFFSKFYKTNLQNNPSGVFYAKWHKTGVIMKTKNISIYVTPEELKYLEAIKTKYLRKSFADTLRILIVMEGQKILHQNNPTGLNQVIASN